MRSVASQASTRRWRFILKRTVLAPFCRGRGARALKADSIRQEVAAILPGYMVPSRIDILERLPKNANGKIDRTLLKSHYC